MKRVYVTTMMLIALGVFLTGCSKSQEDQSLSDTQRTILLERFSEQSTPSQYPPVKRVVSPENPLNVITWYGGAEGVEELWNTLPPSIQEISVLVLIPGNFLMPGGNPQGLLEAATACNNLQIPFLIQNINGETHKAWNPPIAWLEKTFTPMEYFYGLSSAELYNGEEWRGQLDGDNSQYITEMIEFCAANGLIFAWTDTNIFGTNGTIIDWIEENEQLYSVMQSHPQNIIMQNKESYGDPSTYSLMKGLYMAGLIGGWGVATDWWHWQVSNYKSLFNSNNGSIDSDWEQIFWYPEALQSQSLLFVSSGGGTAFKNEAQFYSVAVQNPETKETARTATFEYATLPFFNSILEGPFSIPSREDILASDSFAMIGGTNYKPINYRLRAKTWYLWPLKWLPFQDVAHSLKESSLYPNIPDYGIIPLLPANLRNEERALLESFGIDLLDTKMTEKLLEPYADTSRSKIQGNTFASEINNQKYYLNNLENIDKEKEVTFSNFTSNDVYSLSFSSGPHTYAMVQENPGSLQIHLNNYRVDKNEMMDSLNGSENPQEALYNWITVDPDTGNLRGADDSAKRITTIEITLPSQFTPEISFSQNQDGEHGSRPFSYSFDSPTSQELEKNRGTRHILTVDHNGPVDIIISVPELITDGEITATQQHLPEEQVYSTVPLSPEAQQLQDTIDTWSYVTQTPKSYTETSYHNFYRAWSAGKIAIQEGRKEIYTTLTKEIEASAAILLDITVAIEELQKFTTLTDQQRNSATYESYGKAFDRLLREILSPTLWYEGKDSTLQTKNKTKDYTKKLYKQKSKAIEEALIIYKDAYKNL